MEDIVLLQAIRDKLGVPLAASGYRCPKHNAEVSHTGLTGPHTKSAFDVRVVGTLAIAVIRIALDVGFTGIGVNQKGDRTKRFIHLDRLTAETANSPRPWIWSY